MLRQFANGIDAAGQRVHRAFLASGRVLGEGVDITGERGVEAICFADTRGSQVEIVQNIGRALRLNRAPPVMTGSGRRERIGYAPSVSRAGPRRRAQRCVAFTTVCSFEDG